jgi:hypothetical protein
VSCCPLPKNSASAASTVLVVKASFLAGEEANSRFVFKPEPESPIHYAGPAIRKPAQEKTGPSGWDHRKELVVAVAAAG